MVCQSEGANAVLPRSQDPQNRCLLHSCNARSIWQIWDLRDVFSTILEYCIDLIPNLQCHYCWSLTVFCMRAAICNVRSAVEPPAPQVMSQNVGLRAAILSCLSKRLSTPYIVMLWESDRKNTIQNSSQHLQLWARLVPELRLPSHDQRVRVSTRPTVFWRR